MLLTVRQAAEHLEVSESTIWRMIRRGTLSAIRRGGRRLIPKPALESRTRRRQEKGVPPFGPDHPIFRLVGAGKGGGHSPGAREKHAILDR